MDQQAAGNNLYILDYNTGIYELKLVFNKLVINNQLQFTYYSKMAVNLDSFVISKKGSIT